MSDGVFISYRRKAGGWQALSVFEHLRRYGYDVFMDVRSLDGGPFDEAVLDEISKRQYFVMILTPGTLDRCVNPDDWVRRELEHALKLNRVIIPLMTSDFSFESSRVFLVGQLAELPKQNGLSISVPYFEESMEKLRTHFLSHAGGTLGDVAGRLYLYQNFGSL
jgi:hypothetical protein